MLRGYRWRQQLEPWPLEPLGLLGLLGPLGPRPQGPLGQHHMHQHMHTPRDTTAPRPSARKHTRTPCSHRPRLQPCTDSTEQALTLTLTLTETWLREVRIRKTKGRCWTCSS